MSSSPLPAPASPLEMDEAEMRRLGHQVADEVARHLASLGEQPVHRAKPRASLAGLVPGEAPDDGAPMDELLGWLRHAVFPWHGREPHPGFMGYIPSCPTFPAVLGDWLASGYNFFAGVWTMAAGPNAIELAVLEWFRRWVGMPEGTSGLLTSGGSAATMMAMVAARHAAVGEEWSRLPRLVMYASEQTHSSVPRAAWMAGIPRANVRSIPVDADFRIQVDALEDAIATDRAAGLIPFMVVGNAGTTNTGATDPLEALAACCEREQLWFHVDAAYAGFAAITERGRAMLPGIGLAHTITLDPHKWLFMPFECGCLLARDPRLLAEAFSIHPEYLHDVKAGGEDVNFTDYGLQLTRGSRALKVWLSVRHFGMAALRAQMEYTMQLADLAEQLIRELPGFEITSPARFGIVCFRARPEGLEGAALDRFNMALNERVNATGKFLISSTALRGAFTLRLCALGYRTREEHIRALVAEVARAAQAELATQAVVA